MARWMLHRGRTKFDFRRSTRHSRYSSDDGRILQGITRSGLLDAAKEGGIPLEVRPLHYTEPIDELYATSTLKEMSAVIQLDNEADSVMGLLVQSY